MLPLLEDSPLEQKHWVILKFLLDLPSPTCYNTRMKKMTYTIYNPFSGQQIMDNIPSSKLQAMLRYFAWMCGVQVSSLVYKVNA